MIKSSLTISAIAVAVGILACTRLSQPETPEVRELNLPENNYSYSSTSNEIGTLGRVLFYDKHLSVSNSVSCGSCHMQSLAFTDGKKVSKGFQGVEGERNTPAIQNLMGTEVFGNGEFFFEQSLFWDGRAKNLREMVIMPVVNHGEMGVLDAEDLVAEISALTYYNTLFKDAFGDSIVTVKKIAIALEGFVSSIDARESKFDFSNSGLSNSTLTPMEEEGLNLFFGKYNCGSCHQLFDSRGYSELPGEEVINIGLEFNYDDKGAGNVSGQEEDNGKFKIPNLRNVALTAPYMHDGRFQTLEETIEHYSTGVKRHPNLDERLKDQDGNPVVMNISQSEKKALVAFLQTLTDYAMISDPKFSDPFKNTKK